jgi:hypothetical protein
VSPRSSDEAGSLHGHWNTFGDHTGSTNNSLAVPARHIGKRNNNRWSIPFTGNARTYGKLETRGKQLAGWLENPADAPESPWDKPTDLQQSGWTLQEQEAGRYGNVVEYLSKLGWSADVLGKGMFQVWKQDEHIQDHVRGKVVDRPVSF